MRGRDMGQERTTRLVATLGPASLRTAVLRSLASQGVDLLRLNLSHVAMGDLDETLRTARIHSHLPICLDTEGAQVRVGLVATGVALRVGQPVRLVQEKALGTERQLSLRPEGLFATLEPGTTVAVDEAVLRVAVVAGVDHFALGYATSAAGVEELRALLPAGARLLARIDSRAGVERRAEI